MNHPSKRSAPVVAGLVLLLISAVATAAPDDNWYAGGTSGGMCSESISETWHVLDTTKLPPDGITNDLHSDMKGKRFTLTRVGNSEVWRLIAEDSLNWTPKNIQLKDYPGWMPGDEEWRWISIPQVNIDGHQHHVCIGYPAPGVQPFEDEAHISVIDIDDVEDDENPCPDPGTVHPGHSAVGR